MNDHDLDLLVARAAPVTNADIAEWTRDVPYAELCESIIDHSTGGDTQAAITVLTAPDELRSPPLSRRRTLIGVAAAAIMVIAVTVSLGVTGNDNSAGHRAWAAPLVEFAQRSPLLLIDDPTWHVVRADGQGHHGEMTFTNGRETADLYWNAEPLNALRDDLIADGGIDRGRFPTASGTAAVVEQPNTTSPTSSDVTVTPTLHTVAPVDADTSNEHSQFHAVWEVDGKLVQLVAIAGELEEFTALLAHVTPVDVDTWLAAMPPDVIQAADYANLTAELLNDVPVPDGFDPAAIDIDADVKDRYQFIATISGAVACAWIDQWFTGAEADDTAAQDTAAEALASTRHWPMLLEIESQGGWAQAVWEFADAINDGPGIMIGNGPTPPTRQLAEAGLSCQFG